ncbi:MAG: PAS domain S-box protein [Xenococcaceae cyanobacterium MO_234.B1]|nr:PAS domain S-box protein [Xenococcaceae cyanobacterium MO_234.B1]
MKIKIKFSIFQLMYLELFEQKIQEVQDLLEAWRQKTGEIDPKSLSLAELIEAIGVSLEELNVAVEQLQHQEVELQAANQAIAQEQQRYQELFEFAPNGYLITDSKGIIQEANIPAGNLLKRHPKHLVGKPLVLFISTADRSAYYSLLDHLEQEKQIREVELNLQPHQLQPFPVAISFFAVRDSQNRLTGVRWLLRDITQLKAAEQKIREQAALIDISTDGIFVQDLENHILFWSKGAEGLYGWKAEEAMGKETHKLFYGESSSQLEAALNVTLEQGNWDGELKQITKEGREIIVESRWTLVLDQEENPKSILVFNTNITEKKQLEKQLIHAQRLESLGTLTGGIAHDLNNILTPILGLSQLLPLKNPNLDESSLELLEIINTNALRGADIIKQMLLFARETETEWKSLFLDKLLEEVLKLIRETFPKSIVIEEDIFPHLWLVHGDCTQIHQVLMNLCVNARDAMFDGGKLVISAENLSIDEPYSSTNLDLEVGNYVVITITDTGIGIPENIIDRIFEPFFTTKEPGQGTGLGLSTAIGIVKNHDGAIQIKSESGNGAEFKVYLPASEEVAATETGIMDETIISGQGELILVVDDEALIREVTKTTLETYNYRVLTASDGIEAIAVYAQQPQEFAVVLMDLRMPEMDGLTAMGALKKINPKIKLIVTSGLITKEEITAAEKIGIKAFLAKPYTAEQLLLPLGKAIC